jgi:CRISPR-associated endoribonuclease Cas6
MQDIDLMALVIELKALMPTTIDNHMGRTIQRSGLLAIGETNPALAALIHGMDEQKPFTVSGLMGSHGILYGRVQPGDRAWIRLTGLSADIAAALLAYSETLRAKLQTETVVMQMDRMDWAITAVHHEGHPWAGRSSYQTLLQRQLIPPTHLSLNFVTPATFRSQTVNMPLPLPALVFGSLLSRWTLFTPHRLRDLPQDQLDLFIAHHVVICQHKIQTALVRGKQGGKEIGFSGQAAYELLPQSDHLLRHNPDLEALIQKEYHWFALTLALLADFAFYSGIGRKTTTGMGMTRDGKP